MRSGLVLLAFSLSGCGLTQVDGITVTQNSYDAARGEILARAETQLPCPRAEITLRLLSVHPSGDADRLAANGCGNAVIYRRTGDSYAVETSPPPPER